MPRRKAAKTDCKDDDFVSDLLDHLQSPDVLEQLHWECLADIKNKQTYLQLKDRIDNYVSRKMTTEWVSENTFREQVIECSIIALTVERIVNVVVRQRLKEGLKSLVTNLVKEIGDEKLISRLNGSIAEGVTSPNSSYKKTAQVVQMICHETKRGTKQVLADGLFAKSLASVSFSHSTESDEGNMSDASENSELSAASNHNTRPEDTKCSNPDDEQEDIKPVVNGSPEPVVRARRERKMNPKYSSGLYHTDYIPPAPAIATSTPKKDPPLTNGTHSNANGVSKPKLQGAHSNANEQSKSKLQGAHLNANEQSKPKLQGAHLNANEESKPKTHGPHSNANNEESKPKTQGANKRKKHEPQKNVSFTDEESEEEEKPKIIINEDKLPVAVKSAPVFKKKNIHFKDEEFGEDQLNGNVRKSGRQRKVNSKWFSDFEPRCSRKEMRILMSAHESEPKQSEPKSSEPKLFHGRTLEEKSELIADVEKAQKSRFEPPPSTKVHKGQLDEPPSVRVQRNRVEPPADVQSAAQQSTKRYSSSDLYKPRYTPQSAGRGRRA